MHRPFRTSMEDKIRYGYKEPCWVSCLVCLCMCACIFPSLLGVVHWTETTDLIAPLFSTFLYALYTRYSSLEPRRSHKSMCTRRLKLTFCEVSGKYFQGNKLMYTKQIMPHVRARCACTLKGMICNTNVLVLIGAEWILLDSNNRCEYMPMLGICNVGRYSSTK